MRFILITCILTCLISLTHAQVNNGPAKQNANTSKSRRAVNIMFDLDLKAGIPLNDFGKATNSIPFGFEGSLLFQPDRNLFLFAGIDLGWMQMGSVTQNRSIPVDITANNVLIDHFDIPLKFTIENNITTGHIVLRVTSPTDYVKIYGEGVGGFNYLNTHTTVYDQSDKHYLSTTDNNVIFDKSQIQSFTYSVGGGIGLLIQLGKSSNLNMKASYLFGGPARYFDKNDIQNWDINVSGNYNPSTKNYDNSALSFASIPKSSNTDMLIINLGLTFYLR